LGENTRDTLITPYAPYQTVCEVLVETGRTW